MEFANTLRHPSTGRPILWAPMCRGPHGVWCRCNLPDWLVIPETPERELVVLFHRNGDVSYRYVRRGGASAADHWLRIDWPWEEVDITSCDGDVGRPEPSGEGVRVSFRGHVRIDYRKRGFLSPEGSGYLRYRESLKTKGAARNPHRLVVHAPRLALSALRARSRTTVILGTDQLPVRPAQLSPSLFFVNCELEFDWLLEIDPSGREAASLDDL